MKKNIRVMYSISLLQGMVFYGPIATLYRQTQGVSVFQITLIESISLALTILLEIPWGVFADKIGYRKTMIFCCGLYFVSKIVFWQATGFRGFLFERIMLSVVVSGFSGVDSSILFLSSQGQNSQKVFGIYNSMSMVGLLIAATIFTLFVRDNYRLAGFLTMVCYGIATLLAFGLREVKQPKLSTAQSEPLKTLFCQIITNRTLLLYLIAVAFLSETHQSITVFLNQLQYDCCGLNSTSIGFVYIVTTMLGLLGVYSSAVTKRMGTLGSMMLFGGIAIGSSLVLALTTHAIPSILSVLILRASNSLFQPFQSELQNRQIHTENRATALSVNAMVIDTIAISTNLLFGTLAQWRLPVGFLFGGIISTVSLMLLVLWHFCQV